MKFLSAKTEVPRDVRNSKVRRQDKFKRDWSQHYNTCKSQSGTGPGIQRSKRLSSVGMSHPLQMFCYLLGSEVATKVNDFVATGRHTQSDMQTGRQ